MNKTGAHEISRTRKPVGQAQTMHTHRDGSICHLLHTTQGPPWFSKERVEVYAGGNVAVLEDFRRLDLGTAAGRRRRPWRTDKCHAAELEAFIQAVRSGEAMPIPPESLLKTTLVSPAAVESERRRAPIAPTMLLNSSFARPRPPWHAEHCCLESAAEPTGEQ